nr:hypothetical protein [Fusobacterium necrophorum]
MQTTILKKEGVIHMEQNKREKALKFLQELEDSGKLKSKSEELIRDLHERLLKENISQELENKIFQVIESLKKEYLLFGTLVSKAFEE